MKKKPALLMFIISVFFAFHSCLDYSLPNQIELEVEGSIDLPVKISTSNWGSTLAKSIQDAFSEGMGDGIEGVEVYNVNYGQDVQAFCVYIPIKISNNLDLKGYQDSIANLTKDSILDINNKIDMPSFGEFQIECQLPSTAVSIQSENKIEFPIEISFSSDGSGTNMPTSIGDDFLHALIGKGSFTIDLDLSQGDVDLPKDQFDYIYAINISQISDNRDSLGNYPGLNYLDTPNPTDPNKRILDGQNINAKPVKISGSVTLEPKTGGGTVTKKSGGSNVLKGQLKITMNISEYKELDLDFGKVSVKLDDPEPISLKDAAENVNYISFAQCAVDGSGKDTAGIGIKINFTEIKSGLAMSIECDDLEFSREAKPLQVGGNVFGNTKPLELNLAGYKDDNKKLQFKINLFPSGSNKNVLHLTNLTAGEELKIKGEVKLFQHWVEAGVSVNDTFKGEFPGEDEDAIDLSSLNEYFKGFRFDDIKAATYLSGLEMIANLNMSIDAKYAQESVSIIAGDENNSIKFVEKQIVIADNHDYLDEKGSYKKKELPPGGNDFDFAKIINDRPEDLVFHYELEAPTIKVTPDMLDDNNESALHDIRATIILLIHMSLTAEKNGTCIEFQDMFEGPDLFGRESLEEDSIFTSLNVDHINFTVDFTSPFFTGGKLFIEKNNADYKPILFPNGIPVDGNKISLDIRNKELEVIRNNFIDPDFRLEFEKDGKITIPRNIGLTSVKIEAKGKTSIKLDF